MKVITLDKTKELLGISENTYDSAISSAIPYVDAAVKQITRNRFNYQVVGDVKNGSTIVELTSVYNYIWNSYMRYHDPEFVDYLEEHVQVGQKITGEGIPDDTYIDEVYYNGAAVTLSSEDFSIPTIELTNAATSSKADAQIFLGMNRAFEPIVAKAVWWKTLQVNQNIASEVWQRKSMGPVSVSKSDMDAKLDGRVGMPIWFVKALPHYHGGH